MNEYTIALTSREVQLAYINAERRRNMPGRKQATYTVEYGLPQQDAEVGGLLLEYAYAMFLEDHGLSYEWSAYSEDPAEYRVPDFRHNGKAIELKRVNNRHSITKGADAKMRVADYTVVGYIPYNYDRETQRWTWDTEAIEFYGYYPCVNGKLGERVYSMNEVLERLGAVSC